MKRQLILLSVVYREDEIYSGSAAEAISHRLFNEDGVVEWDFKVKKEESLSADITEDELEGD